MKIKRDGYRILARRSPGVANGHATAPPTSVMNSRRLVCRERLPHRQRFSVDNNATGWAELVERLHALPIAAVGIEPSGGYERGCPGAVIFWSYFR